MARLRQVRSRLRSLPNRIVSHRDAEGHSRDTEPLRRLYSTKAWRELRWRVLLRDRFTCQSEGCGRVEPDTSKLVADHIRPHRGDPALFWDDHNLHTLCSSCHSSAKQRSERRGG